VPEPLQPVFLKATAKFKAFALLESGYAQSNSTILCPLCGLKYILLLDKASATQALMTDAALHNEALRYFRDRICAEHWTGHKSDRLILPT
jgi:hypothetical protein